MIEFHPGEVPAKPGVYIFRDRFSKVIYVGKAINLRRRLSHYFQPAQATRADPKLRSLINSINSWEFMEVRNEDESLILESRLIKQYAPRYNVLMRDDKRYLMVKINLNEQWPYFKMARIRKDDGALYFGPFPQGGALKATIDYLTAYFGLRSCSTPGPEARKHCLKRIVKDCSRPCDGTISEDEYRNLTERMLNVINGDISEVTNALEQKMKEQATAKRFEQAAKTRDIIANIRNIFGSKNRKFTNTIISTVTGEESLLDLQQALGLEKLPTRIECFDNSHLAGTMTVASAVCFIDGAPARGQYRRFRIRSSQNDDVASMKELFSRHFSRKLAEKSELPSLVVVDGGKGQLSAAITALIKVGCPALPVIGLAERNEEIFLPGKSKPLVLERHRPALRLLQAIRDEAHRFAISYNRELRLRRIQNSLLDDIPGIGKIRKKMLLKEFGSVRALRQATPEEITRRVPGIGTIFAQKLHDFLLKSPKM